MISHAREQTIDVAGIYEEASLHACLRTSLGFPAYYGCTWDAFWDCVSSDDQSSMPVVLKVTGIVQLRRNLPEAAKAFEAGLAAYAAAFPDRFVLFV